MNTSKQDPNKNDVMDEVDDLTRFLDEDFDTDDVDLFEFTSEEESPLTQLKSIILSLDWEITDEILQDLIDEIDNLRHQELFESDKVSQVYLQGLDKIAHYIQSEGAKVHPNSIKLLLTLYYDFEKILSSEHITGAEITALLKADVRKFKILQHQIAQKHGVTTSTAEDVASPLPLSEHKDLLGVQAAILELDWEVTDEGLKNLSDQLEGLKTQYEDDHSIKVIIQGLYSLNAYLTEEKGRAHPETFSLIHNFFDALETLVEDEDLDEEKRKEILIDRVNRLNNLKALIAQTYSTEDLAPEAITPVAEPEEELSLDVDVATAPEELDMDMPAEDEVPAKPAAAVESLVPVGDGEDDDEYDEPLVAEGEELPPALSDSSEEAGFGSSGDLEAPPDELEEKLDFFFGSDKEEFKPEAIEEAAALKAAKEREETPVAEEFEDAIAPALAGSVEDTGFTGAGEDMEAPPEELADKLDSFFGPGEDKTPEPEAADDGEAPADTAEEPLVAFEAEEEGGEEIAPALAGSDEETGFTGTGEDMEAPPEELAGNLDAFFGPDEDKAPEAETAGGGEAPADTAEEPLVAFEAEEEGGEEIAPALAGSDEETGFTGTGEDMEAPPEELAGNLDAFFGPDEDKAPEAEATGVGEAPAETAKEPLVAFEAEEESEEEIAPALAGSDEEVGFTGAGEDMDAPPEELADKLDSFFGPDEDKTPEAETTEADEEVLLTPALEEPAEEEIALFDTTGAAPAVTTAGEFQAAVEQMRSSYKELETTMRSEMESMRQEIESLRSQMNK